jgi:hypothetical protein
MICFREQLMGIYKSAGLQDKLRISSVMSGSRQPLRSDKPALKDSATEQLPTPKMKTRAEWEGAVVAPHLYIRLFGLIAQHFLKHDMFENKSLKFC